LRIVIWQTIVITPNRVNPEFPSRVIINILVEIFECPNIRILLHRMIFMFFMAHTIESAGYTIT